MRRSSPRATLAAATSGVVLAGLLGACGGGSDDGDSAASPSPAASSSPTPDPSASATTASGTPTGRVLDICSLVTADEIAAIVGGSVEASPPSGGACSFGHADPGLPSVSLGSAAYDQAAQNLRSSEAAVALVIDGGTAERLPSIGRGAYVIIGTVQGGANTQGGGGVHVADTLVQATLVQGTGMTASQVRRELVAVLRLVASKG